MPVLPSITDTVTLLLNTPIVPPQTDSAPATVPLTDLPQESPRKRLQHPSVGVVHLDTGDVFVLGRTSMESTTASVQSESAMSGGSTGVAPQVTTGPGRSPKDSARGEVETKATRSESSKAR